MDWRTRSSAAAGGGARCTGNGRGRAMAETRDPRHDAPARVDSNDIAIVGIALRFPGAHGPAEFWSNLRGAVESLKQFSDEELVARGVAPRLVANPAYVKCGQVLDGVDQFDAEFFGFSPKDAAILD